MAGRRVDRKKLNEEAKRVRRSLDRSQLVLAIVFTDISKLSAGLVL